MHAALFLAALACAAQPVKFHDTATAARELAPHLETGTLLVSRGDCLAVKVFTDSQFTHVGSVVMGDSGPLVYDTVLATGARRLTLEEYLAALGRGNVQLLHPRRPFGAAETASYRRYLESQLGRPYSLTQYVKGETESGMHCSEYAVSALVAADRAATRNATRVSPGSLAEGVLEAQLYHTGLHFTLAEPPPPVGRNLCEQWWLDTKACCTQSCAQLRRWVFCE